MLALSLSLTRPLIPLAALFDLPLPASLIGAEGAGAANEDPHSVHVIPMMIIIIINNAIFSQSDYVLSVSMTW